MRPKLNRCLIPLMLLWFTGRGEAQMQKNNKVTDTVAPGQKLLKTVTVNTAKPFITQTTDKIILNIAESPLSAGSNAYEALLRAPGVMELGNTLQFRAKTVAVWVDGKNTNLSGEDLKNMLSAMPASTVEKIEILSHPSARYDAQGGAVINIRTTKNKNYGTNGSWVAGIGTGRYVRGNTGINLNYRNTKWNIYGSYDYQNNTQYYDSHTSRLLNAGTWVNSTEYEIRKRNNHAARIGIDYDIDKKNTIGILLKGMDNFRDRAVTNHSVLQQTNSVADSSSTVATTGAASFFNASVNAYYRHTFKAAGNEITFNADYFKYRKAWSDQFVTSFYDENGMAYGDPLLLNDHSPANNDVRSFSVDYVQPLKTIQLEAGAKATFTTTDNDVLWQQQQKGGDWVNDTSKTNHFIYKENIYAAYINAEKTLKKLTIRVGVRGEQTNTTGNSLTLGQLNKNNYLSLFPNIALQYRKSPKQQIGFSYRKSINRFGFDLVNPFVVYQNQYAFYKGNPGIKPSVLHSFELSHAWKSQLFTTLSYTHYNNLVAEVFVKDAASGAIINTTVNLSNAEYVDGNVMFTKTFFNKWNTSNTAGAFYAKYHAGGQNALDNGRVTAYVSSDNTLLLPKGFKIQVSAWFYAPTVWGVNEYRSRYAVHGGASKNIWHNNATLALNVTDIFNTQENRYTVHSYSVVSSNTNKIESRYGKLVFTWRFGNTGMKGVKNRKTGVEDEKNRMGGN